MPTTPTIGFAPDLDRTTPGILTDCTNLIPSTLGMQAAPSSVATDYAALTEAVTGAALTVQLDGTTRFVAGSASYLKEGSGGSWTDVSRGGGYTASDLAWRFAQFGSSMLAANKSCKLQRSTSSGGAFADLTAPKASFVTVIDGFAVVADWDDTGMGLGTTYGDSPNGWWCSAYNDITSWTPSVATQSARGFLVSVPGPITGLRRLGANLVAYKAGGLITGTYVGASGGVIQWTPVKKAVGCASNEAVVDTGTFHLFPGSNDFYLFDGNEPIEIGQNVRAWFFDQLNPSYAYNIKALHDIYSGHVWWFYPGPNSAGELDSAIVYDYRRQRWGVADRSIEAPVEIVLDGITYGTIDSYFATYGDLPDIPYGSPFWSAGRPVPALFGTDHVPYTISGSPGAWAFTTGIVGDDSNVSMLSRVRVHWVTRPSSATLKNYRAMDAGDSFVLHGTRSMNTTRGMFPVRSSANWHQFALNSTGAGEFTGMSVEAEPAAVGAR